jgi:hypothetical protein
MKEITDKTLASLPLLVSAPIITGIYGIIHDQITRIICPEHFTKLIQFGIPHELIHHV